MFNSIFSPNALFQDQVLLSMQQKLDSLCEQVNSIKDQPDMLLIKNVLLPSSEVFASDKLKLVGCGCRLCDQHLGLSNDLMVRNLIMLLQNWVLYLMLGVSVMVAVSSVLIV